MRRRTLLAGLAVGTASLAGCTTGLFTDSTPPRVYNPTGRATIRPIDEPLVRHGLTSDSEQYLYGRLFLPGNSLPVTDATNAAWLAEDVDDLSDGQLAVLTNLRTAGAAPAYVWPADTQWDDGPLRIELERQKGSTDSDADEVIGVALATFEHDDDPPDGADLVFPSGAVFPVGTRK